MIFYGIVLLFFIQLLTAFVAANYSLGLLHNRLPPESASALLLLSPLLLPLVARSGRSGLRVLVAIVVVTCVALPLVGDTRLVVLVTGCGVAASLLLLPLLLHGSDANAPSQLAGGLALAAAASIVFRAAGSGVDASTMTPGHLLTLPLGLFILWSLPSENPAPRTPRDGARAPKVALLTFGLVCVLTLVYFAFSAPNVISRWTGVSYVEVVILSLAALPLWAIFAVLSRGRWQNPRHLFFATLAFALFFMLSILPHQMNFPEEVSAYPLPDPGVPRWTGVLLMGALLLWPILVIDFWKLADRLRALNPPRHELGISFAAAAVFLAAMIFAQIFTTTYDYVPVIGPLFRDRFWIVVTLPAFVLAGTLLSLPRPPDSLWKPGFPLIAGLAALLFASPVVLLAVSTDPQDGAQRTHLTMATYNVQQGYDANNQRNFEGQLKLLRSFEADIVGLQESDTGRVAGGNDDLVRYFADNLNLYSYYGPKTVTGTFGVALLSRYPIEDARTYYLFSEGEQKAVISARLTVAGRQIQLFIVHLGNGGPLIQQEQLLSLVPAQASVIMAGDFNFRPDTPQYRLTVEQLDDAWLEQPSADSLPDPHRDRIDYVFVSSSVDVLEAAYVDSPESNHPAFVVKIAR